MYSADSSNYSYLTGVYPNAEVPLDEVDLIDKVYRLGLSLSESTCVSSSKYWMGFRSSAVNSYRPIRCRNIWLVNRQLSVVPEMFIEYTLASSTNSTRVVKLNGFLWLNCTSTRNLLFAIPSVYPSGKNNLREKLLISYAQLYFKFKFSYPSLTMRNVHLDTTPSGTTGNITSFLSKSNLGYAPEPLRFRST